MVVSTRTAARASRGGTGGSGGLDTGGLQEDPFAQAPAADAPKDRSNDLPDPAARLLTMQNLSLLLAIASDAAKLWLTPSYCDPKHPKGSCG